MLLKLNQKSQIYTYLTQSKAFFNGIYLSHEPFAYITNPTSALFLLSARRGQPTLRKGVKRLIEQGVTYIFYLEQQLDHAVSTKGLCLLSFSAVNFLRVKLVYQLIKLKQISFLTRSSS